MTKPDEERVEEMRHEEEEQAQADAWTEELEELDPEPPIEDDPGA